MTHSLPQRYCLYPSSPQAVHLNGQMVCIFDGSAVTRPNNAKSFFCLLPEQALPQVDGQPSRSLSRTWPTCRLYGNNWYTAQPDSTNDRKRKPAYRCNCICLTPALTEANVLDIRKNDGDKITALVYSKMYWLFKECSIFQVTLTVLETLPLPCYYATGCGVSTSLLWTSKTYH